MGTVTCRKPQIHGVFWLVWKVDEEAEKNRINRCNFTQPPRSVHAVTTFGQLLQSVQILGPDFPFSGQLFKFLSHNPRK